MGRVGVLSRRLAFLPTLSTPLPAGWCHPCRASTPQIQPYVNNFHVPYPGALLVPNNKRRRLEGATVREAGARNGIKPRYMCLRVKFRYLSFASWISDIAWNRSSFNEYICNVFVLYTMCKRIYLIRSVCTFYCSLNVQLAFVYSVCTCFVKFCDSILNSIVIFHQSVRYFILVMFDI